MRTPTVPPDVRAAPRPSDEAKSSDAQRPRITVCLAAPQMFGPTLAAVPGPDLPAQPGPGGRPGLRLRTGRHSTVGEILDIQPELPGRSNIMPRPRGC